MEIDFLYILLVAISGAISSIASNLPIYKHNKEQKKQQKETIELQILKNLEELNKNFQKKD
jgi:hypothetical protein